MKMVNARKGHSISRLSQIVKPSAQLAAIVGHHPLPRSDVVAKVWNHIRVNGLQDLKDRHIILADEKLRLVFGKERALKSELNTLLTRHLTPP